VPTGVSLTSLEASPTAVVRATTTWAEFPSVWGPMLDKVWAFIRQAPPGLHRGGHNVMVYLDEVPNIEIGVQVTGPFDPVGDVVPSTLPVGLAATATGPFSELSRTYEAVGRWCAENGYRRTGPSWEVYGDPAPATGQFDVEVYWSVEADT
jgi:effector-binding domain-containing protein